jgi:putative cell wall-binding protein
MITTEPTAFVTNYSDALSGMVGRIGAQPYALTDPAATGHRDRIQPLLPAGASRPLIVTAGPSDGTAHGVLAFLDPDRDGVRAGAPAPTATTPPGEQLILLADHPPPPEPSPTPTASAEPTPEPSSEPTSSPSPTPPPTTVTRHAGATRVATAVDISRATVPAASTVVIARADQYADALAGAPLAVEVGGSLLLTPGRGLDGLVAAELARLGATRAILLGGTAALSPQVEEDLEVRGIAVERLAGPTRFATAALVAQRLGHRGEVVVTEGAHADPIRGWPDALGASAYAAGQGLPILLVTRDQLPEDTAAALVPGTRVTVVGGRAAVSDEVVEALRARGGIVTRVAGPTRYATSVAIAEAARGRGLEPGTVWLATGLNWPDALAAGAAAGRARGVLLLVDGTNPLGSGETYAWLEATAPDIAEVHLSGGTAAIAAAVEDRIRDIVR